MGRGREVRGAARWEWAAVAMARRWRVVVGVVREWPWPGLGCSGRGSGRWSGRGSRVAVWCVVGVVARPRDW